MAAKVKTSTDSVMSLRVSRFSMNFSFVVSKRERLRLRENGGTGEQYALPERGVNGASFQPSSRGPHAVRRAVCSPSVVTGWSGVKSQLIGA